jgi:SAM-dependent methyltransferase
MSLYLWSIKEPAHRLKTIMERHEYEKLYELEDSYWWFVGRRQLVTALIEKQVPTDEVGPILDVGCGSGGNLAFMARWGYEAGIDLSPLAIDLARRRNLPRLVQASGLALPYADGTFGMVTAFDVLYHRWVTNDDCVVRECYRALRPGGWLLVMDSAVPGLWSHHDEVFYARKRYTLDEVHQMVGGVGFKPHKLSYANSILFPAAVIARLLGRWFPSISNTEMQPLLPWLNRALTGVLGLEATWLQRHNFPIGSSVVCLAQKPPNVEADVQPQHAFRFTQPWRLTTRENHLVQRS